MSLLTHDASRSASVTSRAAPGFGPGRVRFSDAGARILDLGGTGGPPGAPESSSESRPHSFPAEQGVLLSRAARSEPRLDCSRKLWVHEISCPGDISVGSDQDRRGRVDLTEDGEFAVAVVLGVD